MNSNFLRTILDWLTGGTLASIFTNLLGCSGDSLSTAACTAAFIPVKYQAAAGFVFILASFLIKMLAGSGTVTQNIAAPSVPVVPIEKATVGVVTAAQVASPK